MNLNDMILLAGVVLLLMGVLSLYNKKGSDFTYSYMANMIMVFIGVFAIILFILDYYSLVNDKQKLNEIKTLAKNGCFIDGKYDIKGHIKHSLDNNKLTYYELKQILYEESNCQFEKNYKELKR